MLIAHIAHAMSISYPHALFILFKYTWITYIWYIKATCDMNMINNCFCCTICSYRLLSVFWFFKLLLTCIICSYKCTVFNDFWEKVKVEIEVRVALDCLLSVRGVRGHFLFHGNPAKNLFSLVFSFLDTSIQNPKNLCVLLSLLPILQFLHRIVVFVQMTIGNM